MERLTEWKDDKKMLPKTKFTSDFGSANILCRLAEYEDLEEIFREKYTDAVCELLRDKEEFSKWLDRIKWHIKKCDEYARAEEQGLKLPCKIGSAVYVLAECEHIDGVLDGTLYGKNGGFGTATGYYCPYEDNCPHIYYSDDCDECKNKTAVFEDTISAIMYDIDGLHIFTELTKVDGKLGIDVFMVKELAEQALEQMKG